MVTKICRGC